jgi:hypothetical protein
LALNVPWFLAPLLVVMALRVIAALRTRRSKTQATGLPAR